MEIAIGFAAGLFAGYLLWRHRFDALGPLPPIGVVIVDYLRFVGTDLSGMVTDRLNERKWRNAPSPLKPRFCPQCGKPATNAAVDKIMDPHAPGGFTLGPMKVGCDDHPATAETR